MPIPQVAQGDNRQLQNVADILASSKKIVMITGAGISTNCGIPDFRSEEGLYSLIQSQYTRASTTTSQQLEESFLSCDIKSAPTQPQGQPQRLPTNVRGKDLFDSRIWRDPTSTSVFYTFIASLRKQIRDEVKQVTPTHRFIRTIRDSQKLVRCYTQNIDGLESRIDLSMDLERGKGNRARFMAKSKAIPCVPSRRAPGGLMDGGCEVVPLHGDLTVLRCTLCQKNCGWDEQGREATLQRGKAPECFSCALSNRERRDRGKRGTKIGSLRPNIVLYGEEHPAADVVGAITTHDLALGPDVLLILGTSLHVQGVKTLVREFAKCVHARPKGKGKVIFVNLSRPSDSLWADSIDYWVSMDCDAWIGTLRRHRPDIWQLQRELKAQVTKKDIQRPSKDSAAPKQIIQDHKESMIDTPEPIVKTPTKRSPGRPRAKPLAELNNTNTSQPRSRKDKEVPMTESPGVISPEQLPTPPSSTHKHTEQEPRRKRPLSVTDTDEPFTPTKNFRRSAQREDAVPPLDSSPSSKIAKSQYLSGNRRKTDISIWED